MKRVWFSRDGVTQTPWPWPSARAGPPPQSPSARHTCVPDTILRTGMQAYCGRRERDGGGEGRSYHQNKMAGNSSRRRSPGGFDPLTPAVGPAGLQAGAGDAVPRLRGAGEARQAAAPVLHAAHGAVLQPRHDVAHREAAGAVGRRALGGGGERRVKGTLRRKGDPDRLPRLEWEERFILKTRLRTWTTSVTSAPPPVE
ncbi:hypothetical protein EYF80_051068 [Liparis tanakae]|uniref:Uncharacterized protein n=1 Tax=Liparis tanakae TaxID=230148 RepID=A0A4Z2FBX3_9TELE|nr:hypothetical protein EYF80_051068 [Liparis tanakae]